MRAFEQNAIEDFNRIKVIAPGLKELPPVVHLSLDHCVWVVGEWNLWAACFEQVLVDVKTGAERLECGLQPLDRVFLSCTIEALVIHAGDPEKHSQITAFGEKGGFVPQSVHIDLIV